MVPAAKEYPGQHQWNSDPGATSTHGWLARGVGCALDRNVGHVDVDVAIVHVALVSVRRLREQDAQRTESETLAVLYSISAVSNWLLPMILVDICMLSPGPDATHSSFCIE